MYRPTNTRTTLARNGMRQPQARNCSSVVRRVISASAPLASTMPAGAPNCAKLVVKPRRFGSVHSPAISTDPLHSPPTLRPWTNRSDRQQHRAPDADRRVGRHEADADGGDAHHHHRDDEQRLAADAIAVVAEDRRAHRPRDEADEIGRERQQRADEGIRLRERTSAGTPSRRRRRRGRSRTTRWSCRRPTR